VLRQQEEDAPGQEHEDVLRERVGDRDVAGRVDDRGHDEERERGRDREPGVEPRPEGVAQVDGEEENEREKVGEGGHDGRGRSATPTNRVVLPPAVRAPPPMAGTGRIARMAPTSALHRATLIRS
jgi:hypothetical protein